MLGYCFRRKRAAYVCVCLCGDSGCVTNGRIEYGEDNAYYYILNARILRSLYNKTCFTF